MVVNANSFDYKIVFGFENCCKRAKYVRFGIAAQKEAGMAVEVGAEFFR